MEIEPQEIYSMLKIWQEKLLFSPLTGKPYESLVSLRNVFKKMGFQREFDQSIGQFRYMIKGSDIIKMNKKAYEEKNNNKTQRKEGGRPRKSRPKSART